MVGESIETDVDLLVSLVKEKGKISIDETSKILKVPLDVLQTWVDFLLEEEILGIEYKFVTPYLYFNKDPMTKESIKSESEGEYIEEKGAFFEKAKERGLPTKRINELWQKYLTSNIEEIREHFYHRTKSRNLSEHKSKELWDKYYTYLRKVEA